MYYLQVNCWMVMRVKRKREEVLTSSLLSLLSDSNQRPRDYKSRALANWAKEANTFKVERKTRLELATLTLARLCSTNWAISAGCSPWGNRTPLARMKILSTNRYTNGPSFVVLPKQYLFNFAVWTGLEPATPCVTGRYSNQLNYHTIF